MTPRRGALHTSMGARKIERKEITRTLETVEVPVGRNGPRNRERIIVELIKVGAFRECETR